MNEISVYHVDAFTDRVFGGNPAGVVACADGLSEAQMQAIARELNLSETAFLFPADQPTVYRVRYFTPTSEIDFCGHATLGSAWLLATEVAASTASSRVVFETNIGPVPLTWTSDEDGRIREVWMKQVPPQVKPIDVAPEEAAQMIGVQTTDLDEHYPLRLAYTGNWHLLVPLRTRGAIDGAQPNLEALASLNGDLGAATTHLFTFSHRAEDDYDVYTRDFAPVVGIPEDPVTGSANGALAGYLVLEGFLDASRPHALRIAQGDVINRPGRVHVSIHPWAEAPEIWVGGAAAVSIRGRLRLPSL